MKIGIGNDHSAVEMKFAITEQILPRAVTIRSMVKK